jgi:hypothetical protein
VITPAAKGLLLNHKAVFELNKEGLRLYILEVVPEVVEIVIVEYVILFAISLKLIVLLKYILFREER